MSVSSFFNTFEKELYKRGNFSLAAYTAKYLDDKHDEHDEHEYVFIYHISDNLFSFFFSTTNSIHCHSNMPVLWLS